MTIKDETGTFSELAGDYERQGDSHVWKYGEFEFAFIGKYQNMMFLSVLYGFSFEKKSKQVNVIVSL